MKRAVLLLLFFVPLVSGCRTSSSEVKEASGPEILETRNGMEYVEVCDRQNLCKKLSRLVMGTDHLVQSNWTKDGQPEMTEEQLYEVLDEAVKLGINFFDTSPIYVGGVERKLGRWLEARKEKILADSFYYDPTLNPDRELNILSKGGFPFDLYWAKKLEIGTHSDQLKKSLRNEGILAENSELADGSAELTNVPPGTYASRLYGDEEQIKNRVAEELGHTEANLGGGAQVYLMHRDDGDYVNFNEVPRKKTAVKTIMGALSDGELASKYWSIGWSNWETNRVDESIALASEDPELLRPMFNSPYFSLFEMSQRTIHAGGVQVTHREMMDPNFQKGIKLMPYSPLGGFSILDKPEPKWENGKQAAKAAFDSGDPYWQNVFHSIFTAANQDRFDRVERFTVKFNAKHGTNFTIDQMINAYALAHKRTDFLAVGPINIEQLRRTVGSLRLARMLSEKDLEYLYDGQ